MELDGCMMKWMIKKYTLKTPASVNTNPPPAPTRNTAATLRRKATAALDIKMSAPGLSDGSMRA